MYSGGSYNAIALKVYLGSGEPITFHTYTTPDLENWDSCAYGNEWVYLFGSGSNIDPFIIMATLDLVSPDYNFGYLLDGSAGNNLNYRITSAKVTSDRIIWTALNGSDEPSINIYTLNSDYTIGSLLYSHSSSGDSIGYWGSPAPIVLSQHYSDIIFAPFTKTMPDTASG